ncbi:MAG: CTP synthase (glutamine hydrolyzing) [Candidatus Methanomethylophilaceae archaeon]|jgi:CTP synthase|nr:CTP synthase (glutamine hydrolyzing) [Candidatus Methanomethylophilaceae archaeon]NLF34125.1 CTP synthase (glutamine hydrolyzing) [Thermoplasmatales archaeon]
MKLIFVTGGVISGLGKGITASSIGRLLESRGLRVSAIKIDPYLNVDAGTMNPFEHGEVYVLDDGGEVDLDLGNYERFMDIVLTKDHNITTGKIYRSVIEKERRGDYLGKTVQIVPHITDEIKARITAAARDSGADAAIVEVGGTVGDIESMPFLEAARQLARDIGREDSLFIHTTLVPVMGPVGEQKTKPTQHSVKELMSLGIRPDIVVGRCQEPMSEDIRRKISMFCDVPPEAVVSAPNAASIYEVPRILDAQGVTDRIIGQMKLGPLTSGSDMTCWNAFVDRVINPEREIRVALVGKYTALADSYISHLEAFVHAGAERGCRVRVAFIDSDEFMVHPAGELLEGADGVLIPGGFGTRGVGGMIEAARYSRENGIPFLGVCLGFQIATLEIARHLAGLDADSTEFDPGCADPVVFLMDEQKGIGGKGASMRLGAIPVSIARDSAAYRLYGREEVEERHRHRYEVNPDYIGRLEGSGWRFVGRSDSDRRMEIGELRGHPYFVASQFHPEFRSRPGRPSPLHLGLVEAAMAYRYGEGPGTGAFPRDGRAQ